MDEKYMKRCIELAKKTIICDDVPVGSLIIKNNEIIAEAFNTKVKEGKIHCHAEINAINIASNKIGDWRLKDCDMYVTLEPCPMCAGAIQQSRIKRLFIGCSSNLKTNREIIKKILNNDEFYHQVEIIYVNDNECSKMLSEFFSNKRKTR